MASTTPLPNQPASYGPSETALLLLDLQKFILRALNDAPEAKEKLYSSTKALLAAARKHNVPVVHCTIDINRQPLPTSKLAERWADTYEPSFKAFPEGIEEDGEFAAPAGAPDEYGFTRLAGRISALKSEGLLAFLQDRGIKSLVLCGVVSSGCVLSTARGGTDEGFVVTVAGDACWDRTETKHKVVMEEIIPMVAYTAGLDEAVALLNGSAASK